MVHLNRQRGFKSCELSESDTLRSSDPRLLNHCYVPSLFWLLGEMPGNKKGAGRACLQGLEAPGVPQTHRMWPSRAPPAQLRTPSHTGKPQRHHAQPIPRMCTAQPRQRQALWKGFLSWALFPTARKVCLTRLFVCLFFSVYSD